MDIASNIVHLCPKCHDLVEGPGDGAWGRLVALKEKLKLERVADRVAHTVRVKQYEASLERVIENPTIQPVPEMSLRAKRRAQGYLDNEDSRVLHETIFGEESARMYFDADIETFVSWIFRKTTQS